MNRFFKLRTQRKKKERSFTAVQKFLFLIWLVFYLVSANFSQSKLKPLYWEIKLNLFLKGNYLFSDTERILEGTFHGHFRWQGLMEPDEPDIILYHWHTESVSWEVLEKEKREGQEKIISRSTTPPRLKVNAFFRQEEAFWLDFLLENSTTLFSSSQPELQIILPASYLRNLVINGLRYNDYLQGGSNNISIPVIEMNKPEYQQSFSWKWAYPRHYPRLNLNERGTEHRVKIDLYLKAHYKKAP